MRHARVVWFFTAFMIGALGGCKRDADRPSSSSVTQSRERGLFIANYAVPSAADLGDYRPLEVWAEQHPASGEQRLVVRLKGPHVDTEPRVRVVGLDDSRYRSIWSERDGPPYEMWSAPSPLPEFFRLERGGKEIEARRTGG